jgi:hypothetical protein
MYLRYHKDGWSLAPFLRVNWWRWLLLLVLAGGVAWIAMPFWPWVAGLVIGLCAGAFLRDIGRLQVSYRTWPVVEEITNWEKVKELLETYDRTP